MKVKVRFPLEVGKTYYTADGLEVRVYATDGGGFYQIHGAFFEAGKWYICEWTASGKKSSDGCSNFDILYEKWEPEDKELVWVWDSHYEYGRQLRFYDAEYKTTFNVTSGKRGGSSYENYAPYEGEWPEWAKEAYKKLED